MPVFCPSLLGPLCLVLLFDDREERVQPLVKANRLEGQLLFKDGLARHIAPSWHLALNADFKPLIQGTVAKSSR